MKKTLCVAVAAFACLVSSASQAYSIALSHQTRGLTCEGCHTVMPQVDNKKCLMCHGPQEKLAKSNPQHEALKTGDMPCRICHKGHDR